VPHDLDGLAALIGGRDALADKLARLFTTPPRFDIGRYPEEIHEMTEMALARDVRGRNFGQYAHSNQPSHNILWQLHALGRTDFAQQQIDRVCQSLYTPDDLPGDEDNGEMSAWYLLSVLGQPRACPGRQPVLRRS
jgi:putative alpha-1,2-mannosidase